MKKKTYREWQRILITWMLVLILELIAWMCARLLGGLQVHTAVRLLVAVVFCGQLLGLGLLLGKQNKRDSAYHKLCQRFIHGEIYQEFINQMESWDADTGEAIQRLDELIERKNVLQMSNRQAEFLALQNQINPHFLYNTLEAIRGDALCIGAETIADITEALSIFFRYTITNTRHLVTLQDELDNVENYFLIQKYRFEDKLDLRIIFKDDERLLRQMPCPKLSLQPIVENAIFHGIERNRAGGLVEIELEFVDDTVHVTIRDNGRGMDTETLQRLNEKLMRASVGYVKDEEARKKGGIALRNVGRRIQLLFGEEYGLHVSSIEGIGTSVEMVLPMRGEEKSL